MRQLLVGKNVAAAAAGAVNFYGRDANGVDKLLTTALMGALKANDEFRVKIVGSDVKSAWMKKGDVTVSSSTAIGAAQTAQSIALTFVNTTAADLVTVKFIETAAGYEPFVRKSYEVAGNAIGTNLLAAIVADPVDFIASSSSSGATNCAVVGTKYAGGDAGLTNIQIAFDANGSAATASVVNTVAVKGVGDPYFLADVEKSLLGSGLADYYRATYLPQANDIQVITTGFAYGLYNLSWKNSSAGQINGVDNVREIIIAEANSAASTAAAAKAAADRTNLIVAAI